MGVIAALVTIFGAVITVLVVMLTIISFTVMVFDRERSQDTRRARARVSREFRGVEGLRLLYEALP